MRTITVCLSLLIIAASAGKLFAQSAEEIIKTEKAFSDMSLEKGMKAAFSHFCHEKGVILRPDQFPVIGKEAVMKIYENTPDSIFVLTWEPLEARIARSGELGYSYGIYKLNFLSEEIEDQEGSYVTIWMKNEEGEWRYLLDTGQEGLGEQD